MCSLLLAAALAHAATDSVSADGFVTQTTGSVLHVGTLSVQLSEQTRCSKYDDAYAARMFSERVRQISTPCASLALSVGNYVHLAGTRMDDGSLAATDLEISDPWRVLEVNPPAKKAPRLIPWFRMLSSQSGGPLRGKLRGGSFLEEPPIMVQTNAGVVAHLYVNGFPMEATQSTAMSVVPRNIDRKSMVRYGTNNVGDSIIFQQQPKHLPLIFPATDKLLPGIYLAYRGTQESDGHMTATSLTIFPNPAVTFKMDSLDRSAPQITEPDYDMHSPGSIRYKYGDAIQILPERAIQEYVHSVGMDILPGYKKSMNQPASAKINFRFYVVHPFENLRKNGFVQIDGRNTLPVDWRGSNWRGLDSPFVHPADSSQVNRIVEMPDGVILIPDISLARLHNKAQLAFALSVAVQSIVQRQEYIAVGAMQYGTGEYAMPPSGISYIETMLALRMSIRQMYLAGYDIREAPFTWKYERGLPVSNPVINSPHPSQDFPWYAAYAFNYISQYYKDVDYSKLKKGEAEYAQFLDELRKADPTAFEKK